MKEMLLILFLFIPTLAYSNCSPLVIRHDDPKQKSRGLCVGDYVAFNQSEEPITKRDYAGYAIVTEIKKFKSGFSVLIDTKLPNNKVHCWSATNFGKWQNLCSKYLRVEGPVEKIQRAMLRINKGDYSLNTEPFFR